MINVRKKRYTTRKQKVCKVALDLDQHVHLTASKSREFGPTPHATFLIQFENYRRRCYFIVCLSNILSFSLEGQTADSIQLLLSAEVLESKLAHNIPLWLSFDKMNFVLLRIKQETEIYRELTRFLPLIPIKGTLRA